MQMRDTLRGRRGALALAILAAASAISSQSADPLAQARSLLESGDLSKSEEFLHRYTYSHPGSAEARFLLGYVLFREQKATESLAEFTAAARLRVPKADELKTVASDYVLLKDYADADKWFTEVTVESPRDSDAWYLLGRTQYNENAFDEAISSFEHALVLRPKYIEAENNLGLSLSELNMQEKAKAAYLTAIEWQGDTPTDPQPFLNLGALLVDQGNLDESIPYLSKADSLSPANPKIHEELAQAYEAQKNLPKAQAELEQAVTLAPNASGLHFKLGQIYRHEGLGDRAKHEFELSEKLNSTHSSAQTPNPFTPSPR
jgi:tetratricopeptide (TPR) repeat protein